MAGDVNLQQLRALEYGVCSKPLSQNQPEALLERLVFLASGQDDPHSLALTEAAAEIRRLIADAARLRSMLCVAHCPGAYTNDGEASDCSMAPAIDFKRDTVDWIEAALAMRADQKIRAAINSDAKPE